MSTLQTVRRQLATARDAGLDFAAAWEAALRTVDDPAWADALARTSRAWRDAYVGAPAERLAAAADMVSRDANGELTDPDHARCPGCGASLPATSSRGRRVFCGDLCRRRDARRRESTSAA